MQTPTSQQQQAHDGDSAVPGLTFPASADTDPFFHRNHGFLYAPFKFMTAVSFAEPVFEWMKSLFGSGVAASEQPRLLTMEKRRNQLKVMSECSPKTFSIKAFESAYLPASSSYINDLSSLILKTQGTFYEGGIPNLKFIWGHWMGTNHAGVDTNSLRVELYGVIFNLAAAYSLLGCLTPEEFQQQQVVFKNYMVKESSKLLVFRVKMFRYAAAIFANLKARLDSNPSASLPGELNKDTISMLCNVMLAQAQECCYRVYKQAYGTPIAEGTCAQLAIAASSYYLEFLTGYQRVQEHYNTLVSNIEETEDAYAEVSDKEPSNQIPTPWISHCNCVRAMLRALVLIHYQRSLESDPDNTGARLGYIGKAFTVIKERLDVMSHPDSNEDPDERLVAALNFMKDSLAALHSQLKYDNDKVYHSTVPTKESIDALEIKTLSKVTGLPTIDGAPLLAAVFQAPKDSFPSILSITSSNAWLRYRQKRIETYLAHLNIMTQCNARIIAMLDAHPEYLLLYFMYHRLKAAMGHTVPPGFFQSRLGSEMLLIKNPSSYAQLSNITTRLLPDIRKRASSVMSKLKEDVEQMRQIGASDMVDKRYAILSKEHELCIASPAGEALDKFKSLQSIYDALQKADPEKGLVQMLVGPFKQVLFEAPRPIPIAKIVEDVSGKTKKASTQQGYSLFAGVLSWGSNEEAAATTAHLVAMDPPIPDQALVFTTTSESPKLNVSAEQLFATLASSNPAVALSVVIATIFDQHYVEREKLEDKIAEELLTDIDRKDVELQPEETDDIDNWLENKVVWIMSRSDKIYQHSEQEKILIGKLEELDMSAAITCDSQVQAALAPILKELVDANCRAAEAEAAIARNSSAKQRPQQDGSASSTSAENTVVPSAPIQNPSPAEVPSMLSFNMRPLVGAVQDTFKFKQCKRFATLCKRMEELVDQDAQAISSQCTDVLASAKSAEAQSQAEAASRAALTATTMTNTQRRGGGRGGGLSPHQQKRP